MTKDPRMFNDPVHGAIQVDRLEWLIIRSRPVQRLKGIAQLGLVEAVYPGANHTRFEHSLGTMHMAGHMASRLGLSPEEVRLVRLAGLLHDLGFDDAAPGPAQEMHRTEDEILQHLGYGLVYNRDVRAQ